MKKITVCFFLFAVLGLRLPAEDSVEQLMYSNEHVWFPRLRAKLFEIYDYCKEDEYLESDRFGELQNEVRDLFLEYFQTDESLLFDPAQFDTGNRSNEETYYISSDDGAIRVFVWNTITRYNRSGRLSLIQYRDPDGKLRTADLAQIIENEDYALVDTGPELGIERIITLKEDVYLLYARYQQDWHIVDNFITVALKEDTVVPYHAFNNKMYLVLSLPWMIPTSPMTADIQVFLEEKPFFIEITQLWVEHPEQVESLYFERIRKEAFEHKEIFVFNGVEFAGNYSLLVRITKGPVDITRFFPEIESWGSVIEQGREIQTEATFPSAANGKNTRSNLYIVIIAAVALAAAVFIVVKKRRRGK